MRIICPICGREGSIQMRGKGARVGHYKGIQGKTRVVKWHPITKEQLQRVFTNLVNKSDSTSKSILSSNQKSERLVEPSAGFGPATITLPR
jgi:hypothetical protein